MADASLSLALPHQVVNPLSRALRLVLGLSELRLGFSALSSSTASKEIAAAEQVDRSTRCFRRPPPSAPSRISHPCSHPSRAVSCGIRSLCNLVTRAVHALQQLALRSYVKLSNSHEAQTVESRVKRADEGISSLEDEMLRAFDWLTSRIDQLQQMQAATVVGELRQLRHQMGEMEKSLQEMKR